MRTYPAANRTAKQKLPPCHEIAIVKHGLLLKVPKSWRNDSRYIYHQEKIVAEQLSLIRTPGKPGVYMAVMEATGQSSPDFTKHDPCFQWIADQLKEQGA